MIDGQPVYCIGLIAAGANDISDTGWVHSSPGTATSKVRSTSFSKAVKLSVFLRIWGLISFETLKKMITFCVIDGLAILEILCKHKSGFQISL